MFICHYNTSRDHSANKSIQSASQHGASLNIIQGLLVGFGATFYSTLILGVVIYSGFYLAHFYGVALVGIGFISISPLVLASNSF